MYISRDFPSFFFFKPSTAFTTLSKSNSFPATCKTDVITGFTAFAGAFFSAFAGAAAFFAAGFLPGFLGSAFVSAFAETFTSSLVAGAATVFASSFFAGDVFFAAGFLPAFFTAFLSVSLSETFTIFVLPFSSKTIFVPSVIASGSRTISCFSSFT